MYKQEWKYMDIYTNNYTNHLSYVFQIRMDVMTLIFILIMLPTLFSNIYYSNFQ